MAKAFETPDATTYRMEYKEPHRELEPLDNEITVVGEALDTLVECGMLPTAVYPYKKMLAHRKAVAERFDIPWTAITPRMQRLLYAVNAIAMPKRMIAAGVFCGNTFISNAGAAVGPGACYDAKDLAGVEIDPGEAARAERNVRRIDPTGVARVLAADAVDIVRDYPDPINLLYLDASAPDEHGKGIYLDILEAAYDKMPSGALILAHNSANCAERLQQYLAFVRDPAHCRESVNVIFDIEGLEVSAK